MNKQIQDTIPSLPGWCSIKKANALYDLCVNSKAKTIVELGCFGMRAGISMANAAMDNDGMYYGIDAYDPKPCLEGTGNPDNDKYWLTDVDFESVFWKGMEATLKSGLIKWTNILKLRTDEAFILFKKIDVLYVDANFTNESTCKDVQNYAPLINEGGYLVLNNSDWATKIKAKELILNYGFILFSQDKDEDGCCWAIYQKIENPDKKIHVEEVKTESENLHTEAAKPEVKNEEPKNDVTSKEKYPIYDPSLKTPCAPIPETPFDIALRGGMDIGPLKVQPMLLYLPDTAFFVERWKNSMKHFEENGLKNIIEVAGIHGKEWGIEGVHTYDRDNPGENYRIGPGYTAQFLSVYMMYNIANVLPFEHFLFLECDAKLIPDFLHHLGRELENVPKDFDWLWAGHCCCQDKLKKHVAGNVYEFDKSTSWPNCGHAFIVSRKCLPYVIQTNRDCYAPSDLSLMFHTFPHLKTYGIFPGLATQFNNELPL